MNDLMRTKRGPADNAMQAHDFMIAPSNFFIGVSANVKMESKRDNLMNHYHSPLLYICQAHRHNV